MVAVAAAALGAAASVGAAAAAVVAVGQNAACKGGGPAQQRLVLLLLLLLLLPNAVRPPDGWRPRPPSPSCGEVVGRGRPQRVMRGRRRRRRSAWGWGAGRGALLAAAARNPAAARGRCSLKKKSELFLVFNLFSVPGNCRKQEHVETQRKCYLLRKSSLSFST